MLHRLYSKIIVAFLASLPANVWAVSGYIDTPDQCYMAEKTEASEVWLKQMGVCEGKPGRLFVQAPPGSKQRVYINGQPWADVEVKPMEMSDVTAVLDKAQQNAKEIKTDNIHEKSMREKAGQTNDYYRSREFQASLDSQMANIKKQLAPATEGYYSEVPAGGGDQESPGESDGDRSDRLYIFVSSSMPMQTLRNYAADVEKIGAKRVVMVMRGFVDGMHKITPTIQFLANVVKKQPTCDVTTGECDMRGTNIIVDPMLFRRYGVERVPTFVYVQGAEFSDPSGSEGDSAHVKSDGEVTRATGDASLKYILTKFQAAKNSESIDSFLSRL